MLYLGPWVWWLPGARGFAHWAAPAGANHIVDLRSGPMCSMAGGVPQGHAIFEAPAGALGDPYLALGETGDFLTTLQRAEIARRLGLLSALASSRTGDAIWEVLTTKADPLGQDNAPPLTPTSRGELELIVGRASRKVKLTATRPEWPAIQARFRDDYRRLRTASLEGTVKLDAHRRILTDWSRRLGMADDEYRAFVPPDLPQDEGPLPIATTFSEGFNKADGALGPDLTWSTIDTQSWNVVSNAAQTNAGTGFAYGSRADHDVSSDNHSVQVTLRSPVTQPETSGVAFVKDGTSTLTNYIVDVDEDTTWHTAKRVAGSHTTIGTNSTVTAADGDTLKGAKDGSTIRRYRNGSEQNSVTDTTITGNLRGALWAFVSSGTADGQRCAAFVIADLAVSAIIVSGNVQSQVSDTTAEADVIVVASGTPQSSAADVTVDIGPVGVISGAVQSPTADITVNADVLASFAGDVEASASDTSGAVAVRVAITGDIESQPSAASGDLELVTADRTISGPLQASAAVGDGEAVVIVVASGAPQSQPADITVNISPIADLGGDVESGISVLDGELSQAFLISGALQAGDAEATGTLDTLSSLIGNMQAQAANGNAAATVRVSATGALQTQPAITTAAGAVIVVMGPNTVVALPASLNGVLLIAPDVEFRGAIEFTALYQTKISGNAIYYTGIPLEAKAKLR